jgi:MFS family permease
MTIMHAPPQTRSRPSVTRRRAPAVPRRIAFWLLALVLTVTMLGLFSSLVPGFLAGQLHQGSHAVQGAVVFLLFAVGTVTQVASSRLRSDRVVLAGLGLFLAALALIVAGLAQSGMALFLAGTVAGGVAVGAIFLGSLATANRLAPAERRGHAISAFFVACYAGLIIPVVGVGVLSEFTGTFPAVLTFSILLAALCLFSISRFAPVRGDR